MNEPASPLRSVSLESIALDGLQSMGAGVIVCDNGGAVLCFNPTAEEILEQPLGQVEMIDDVLVDFETLLNLADHATRHTLKLGDRALGFRVNRTAEDRFVILFLDITEQVLLRAERDRLLQFSTLNEVLPSVLHEVRNPLAAVTSAVELLVEDAEDGSGPTAVEDLHAVLGELRRMELVFQGLGSAGGQLRSSRLHAIDRAAEEVMKIMQHRARNAQVILEDEIELMPLLPVDPSVYKALVFNLVSNAIYACDPGGRVVLSVGLQGDTLRMCIRDNGRGMSPEVLAVCTRAFFTTRTNGSGLGLKICQEIMEEAGGSLDIQSHVGQGTRVCISLRLAPT